MKRKDSKIQVIEYSNGIKVVLSPEYGTKKFDKFASLFGRIQRKELISYTR